ncbi:MAG: methyltransferase domain-containing protein [Myxococcota bacterium]|nr:methyltransferase domain-containing protein [Myxococcota bacterium]
MEHSQPLEREWFHKVYQTNYLAPVETPPTANVIEALLLTPDSVVVEFGAGSGHFTLPVATRLKRTAGLGLIFGFEYSAALVEKLDEAAVLLELEGRVRSWPLTNMAVSDVLPIQDAKVDRVLAVNSAHYLHDPSRICQEFARILKPGGCALVADWHRRVDERAQNTRTVNFSPTDVLKCLSDVGLGVITPLSLEGYAWAFRATKL